MSLTFFVSFFFCSTTKKWFNFYCISIFLCKKFALQKCFMQKNMKKYSRRSAHAQSVNGKISRIKNKKILNIFLQLIYGKKKKSHQKQNLRWHWKAFYDTKKVSWTLFEFLMWLHTYTHTHTSEGKVKVGPFYECPEGLTTSSNWILKTP